jgi:hypothetical protein
LDSEGRHFGNWNSWGWNWGIKEAIAKLSKRIAKGFVLERRGR